MDFLINSRTEFNQMNVQNIENTDFISEILQKMKNYNFLNALILRIFINLSYLKVLANLMKKV